MTDTDKLAEAIDSIISDVTDSVHQSKSLFSENDHLREKNRCLQEENSVLHFEIEKKNKSMEELLGEFDRLNHQKTQFLDDMGQHFEVKSTVVELKYEVSLRVEAIIIFHLSFYKIVFLQIEILNSKIRNLERDLVVQKNENERLRRSSQSLGSGRK